MRITRLATLLLAAALGLAVLPTAAHADPKDKKTAAQKRKKKEKDPGTIARFPGFETKDDGGSRIFVDVSRSIQVQEHSSGLFLTFNMGDVHIEAGNDKNALETYFHNTPVLRARLKRHKKDTVLEIQLRADAKATSRVVETKQGTFRLEVDFAAGSFAGSKDRDRPPAGSKAPESDDKKKKSKKLGAAPGPKRSVVFATGTGGGRTADL